MTSSRIRNVRLRALLVEAEWTGGDLARAVNQAGSENGLPLAYQRASVGQWLSGTRPRPPVPSLIAEALSRRLRRRVTAEQAGFGAGAEDVPAPPPVADQLTRLAEDITRHATVGRLFEVRSLDVPPFVPLPVSLPVSLPAPRPAPHARASPRRVGPAEVGAARAALRVFGEADAMMGGGAMRRALADYLSGTTARWLRMAAESEQVRRDLLAVAAELTYLCGFMCFDDELNGPAQRYYRIALALASEAGDPVRYAITLRAMSVQAHALGHPRQAAAIADAAVDTAGSGVPPATMAFLLGQAAVAAAATGERHRAATCLVAADRHLERSAPSEAVVGAYHHAALAHQRSAVAGLGGHRSAAVAAATESLRLRPGGEHRARVLLLARLAELRLDSGQFESAVETWHRFLDAYPLVRSARARSAMATLRARLRPHQNLPGVRALLRRAVVLRS